MIWKDCTSYSRNGRDRVPSAFDTEIGGLRISIVSNHIYHRGRWVMHCLDVGIDTKPLAEGITQEQAQCQAVAIVQAKVEGWARAFASTKREEP